ncbi:threonine synthase [Salibacterium halotolerans]|uniref:Threonine synthase n=1 Tax=Salibacterium halotolerans TaxID=1884432 RepID=A0A1I5VA37_9BACI|nr:threonine synthase [Salibacterium halotolerans]SFQ04365.1 threonine synthase [Salibacterium halotolerans]
MYQAYSYLSHLYCPRCIRRHDSSVPQQTCSCNAPLLSAYDMDALKIQYRKETVMVRPPSIWRYHELLPVRSEKNVVSMGEGMTPLLPMPKTGGRYDIAALFLKDDSVLPSGSTEARGAAVGMSKLKELNIPDAVLAANGHAGAAWALYGSRASITSHVAIPVESPLSIRKECAASGADLQLINGFVQEAEDAAERASQRHDWFDATPFKEPYRIEGQKTIGLELAEQLQWKLPDVIACPVGAGTSFIGIYKALQELIELGWVYSEKMPKLVAVQSENCAPIVHAFENKQTETTEVPESYSAAFEINTGTSAGDFLILEAIYETKGAAVAVSEEDLLAEQRLVTREEGLFVSPEGATVFAGVRSLREENWIHRGDRVVCINTAMGVKSPETIEGSTPILAPEDDW